MEESTRPTGERAPLHHLRGIDERHCRRLRVRLAGCHAALIPRASGHPFEYGDVAFDCLFAGRAVPPRMSELRGRRHRQLDPHRKG
jgi:hypothetical protein